MDQTAATEMEKRRPAKPRDTPNKLRDWLETPPRPMSKIRFAELVGVTPSYISMLLADNAPWPGREVARRIAEVSGGAITPNDLANWPD